VIPLGENGSIDVTEAGTQSEFSDLQNQNACSAILSSPDGDLNITD
jgi:hypothetical protein